MSDQKNMILAIALSIAILVLFETFFNTGKVPPQQTAEQMAEQAKTQNASPTPAVPTQSAQANIPTIPGSATTANTEKMVEQSRKAALDSVQRITINAPRLHGSIALKGGVIDDVTLSDYHQTVDKKSPEIVVLSPRGSVDAYFTGYGWTGADGQPMPGLDTPWTADSRTLTVDKPVTLTWDNGHGLIFKRIISVDANFMFGIEQQVENTTDKALTLYPFGLLSRYGTPHTTNFYILHEGLLGVVDGKLKEIKYTDLQEEPAGDSAESTGGWVGITDKYWLATLIPNQAEKVQTRFLHRKEGVVDVYQADYLGAPVVIPAGGSGSTKSHMFAGAKEVNLLDNYAEKFGIINFDLAIDFGWFYFLTKPIFLALLWIHALVGNLGVSILLLTVAIKILFFPLANKSYTSMSKMKKLQPQMVKLRERFADDKVKLNQEMMSLYKREKVNPASGCLPILLQIPVFFSLYKVLFVTIEMRQAPFFGWIQDLSAPDPTTIFNLFGLIPFTPPEMLMIGIWPLIMGVSMFIQQRLNPQPADPIQAKIFLFMPIFFTFLLAKFPAGLVIYWAWNNTLSILQQWVIMRRMGIKAKEALN
jgi:YidC/Oxa1 family membrane protein insertase